MNELKKCIKMGISFLIMKKGFPNTKIKVRLDNTNQNECPLLQKTGYYDPDKKEIVLFVNGRHIKDILRSLFHEMIHFKQDYDGNLNGYDGDTLIHGNDKLINLEKEAYTLGNCYFREFTETFGENRK